MHGLATGHVGRHATEEDGRNQLHQWGNPSFYIGISQFGALFDFISDHMKLAQDVGAEGCCECDVAGVAAGGHEDSAYARFVVAGIAGPPLAAEVDFEPGGKIHWIGDCGDADVAEVAGDVAGGNAQGPQERDAEVHEVAADALLVVKNVVGGFGGVGESISEGDVIVHPVDDGLHSGPAEGGVAEMFPSESGQLVDFAVSAGEEQRQH
jgi:hypothetical protein